MTQTEYRKILLAYLKNRPSERAFTLVVRIVSEWTEDPSAPWGEELHQEIFGPPVTCIECGSVNYVPDDFCDCGAKLEWPKA